ncbi:MAG: glycosyltransferase family 2 protein [Planctomycetota bacterium]
MRIAVVIPTRNEADHLGATLDSLTDGAPDALVVADCDSEDGTARIARDRGAAVLTGHGFDSRAAALRAGVEHLFIAAEDVQATRFDAIWFLHGDTLAPAGWREALESALADPAVVGGAFTQRFLPVLPRPTWAQRRLLRFACFANRLRYRVTGVYFGDQGLFVRPAALQAIGGVPQAPLMEDVELCKKLRREGRLRVSPVRISTSPRRFLRHGVVRQLLCDGWLLLRHRLGIPSENNYAAYNRDNQRPAATP